MKEIFEITETSRRLLQHLIEPLTLAQLNKMPDGFNNNIIWNVGHIIVVQQMLVYNLSGLPMQVSADLVSKYKKGTQPMEPATEADVTLLKELLFRPLPKPKGILITLFLKTLWNIKSWLVSLLKTWRMPSLLSITMEPYILPLLWVWKS